MIYKVYTRSSEEQSGNTTLQECILGGCKDYWDALKEMQYILAKAESSEVVVKIEEPDDKEDDDDW